jgi:hypothetical protein
LLHSCNHTTALASATFLNSALLAALATAWLANTLSVNSDLGLLAHINFFQCNFQRMLHWLHFLRAFLLTTTTAHAKHLAEDVIHATSMSAAIFKTFLAVLVVDVTLLLVR